MNELLSRHDLAQVAYSFFRARHVAPFTARRQAGVRYLRFCRIARSYIARARAAQTANRTDVCPYCQAHMVNFTTAEFIEHLEACYDRRPTEQFPEQAQKLSSYPGVRVPSACPAGAGCSGSGDSIIPTESALRSGLV